MMHAKWAFIMVNRIISKVNNFVPLLVILFTFYSCEKFYAVTLFEKIANSQVQSGDKYWGVCSYYGSTSIESLQINASDSLVLYFHIELYDSINIDRVKLSNLSKNEIVKSKHKIRDIEVKIIENESNGNDRKRVEVIFEVVLSGKITHNEVFNEIGELHLGNIKSNSGQKIYYVKINNM